MKKSNSNQVFPKYEYIVYCIVLIFGQTYFTYSSYDGFWLSLFNNTATLFSGLLLLFWNEYYSITRIMWAILPVLPIFIAGARNFSPPYSTFIRFYFISNIMGFILFRVLNDLTGYEFFTVIMYIIAISMLILHLNIILSKNPIVKGVDNLAIKLPSSSGSSSLGDDLD
jgi:membrane-associated HD superfamily phosphohydrolase